ncbi:2,3-diketo-5-methylthiopentyl-1-phosphate enolase [Paenalkalicoccus suaedae]|uniref:2,3-diketo-5-methylthiopentyl-1-phosphate enolase n=1 Tax=Paenalkalicoccus suaedae TaxID=2592382 RepID=A0A859FAS6_9BACI|nr:2,3-diketo-5-methylthiopentyl-1-phosphate enolase [Paenalkalicoccus suaedae]QKS69882.1 2,3-diketo-5-methylthiopentyl-1-phosphate enolase [Paenalkalicoccus suaedae]
MSFVTATYLVPGGLDLHKKAEGIALGLTVGSWTDLPALEQAQLKKHKGEVIATNDGTPKATITIRYPAVNFTPDIPAILTTIFGKLSLDGEIKLVDIAFDDALAKQFPGPQFGVDGIRELIGVHDRPLVMSIFKGMIGKGLDEFETQLDAQARGGVDLVKDDEILFDNPLTPFEERVKRGKHILDKVEQETGRRVLYAVNLSGRTFELRDKARKAVKLGASALLFNVFAYGLDTLQALAEDPEINVPIMAHPAVSGALTASPDYGIANSVLLGKLLRIAGADLVLFPSPYGSVALPKEETDAIALALTEPTVHRAAYPVPSAGIHPGLVPHLVRDFGEISVINAGGGIHGHPDGSAAGATAFRQAVDAVLDDTSLEDAALQKAELAAAIKLWGHPL